jgi:hypothetical protein
VISGKLDTAVYRTSGGRAQPLIEQAGKGAAEIGRVAILTPSVPPLSRHMKILAGAG